MAPHAEDTFVDTSGYTPSLNRIAELRRELRLQHAVSLPRAAWVTDGPMLVDSHDRISGVEHRILQLSLDDLREIEDAVNYFNCMG